MWNSWQTWCFSSFKQGITFFGWILNEWIAFRDFKQIQKNLSNLAYKQMSMKCCIFTVGSDNKKYTFIWLCQLLGLLSKNNKFLFFGVVVETLCLTNSRCNELFWGSLQSSLYREFTIHGFQISQILVQSNRFVTYYQDSWEPSIRSCNSS